MWDPPHTVGVLSNLTYHLTVTIMNTGVVIINTTTTDTTHAIIYPQLCVDYAVCVAAFSPEYRGRSVFIMKRTPGSKRIVITLCIVVYCIKFTMHCLLF